MNRPVTILVTGSNGLLGQKIVYGLIGCEGVRCIATSRGENRLRNTAGYEYAPMDITDATRVAEVIGRYRPEAVIHTAALTNVDACESRREEAVLMNVRATEYLVEACNRAGAHLVHLSTDFVFDGANGPYLETDRPNPLSHYAMTKLESEEVVTKQANSWAILRTIIIYGVVDDNSRSNVVLWTFNSLRAGKPINAINDQFRSPTLAEDLADACIEAAMRKATGIYHVSGRELMCILDIVKIVADYFGLDASLIRSVSSEELNQPARRPPVTGFLIGKAERELGFRPHSFLDGLAVVKKQLIMVGALQES
jgi:dTDP-4-dehydrorhamnose reductase